MLKVEFSCKADLSFMEERSTGEYCMLITSVQLWPHCLPRPAAGGWDVLVCYHPGPSQCRGQLWLLQLCSPWFSHQTPGTCWVYFWERLLQLLSVQPSPGTYNLPHPTKLRPNSRAILLFQEAVTFTPQKFLIAHPSSHWWWEDIKLSEYSF